MKVLSKINRGLILTVVVLLGVIGYLIGLEIVQNGARKDIQAVCEKYVAAEVSYRMLPEANRSDTPNLSTEALETYLSNMKQDLTSYYVDNEQTYRYLLDSMEDSLRAQAEGEGVVYQYDKEIIKMDITFRGDMATVSLTCSNTYRGPSDMAYSKQTAPAAVKTIQGETTDSITLQRVEGEWKLTYSNLSTPYPESSGMYY